MAQQRSQRAYVLGRPERSPEQAYGVEILQPLAVGDIRPTAGYVLDMAGIDQAYLESACLQDLKQGNPVDAGGFHRHRADTACLKPVGQGVQIWRKRGETSDRLRVAIFWHRHVHLGGADIDAGSIRLHHGESGTGWIEFSRHSHLCGFTLRRAGRSKLLKSGSLLNGIVGLQERERTSPLT